MSQVGSNGGREPGRSATICVGCVGSGVFTSRDGGATWAQGVMKMPYPPWSPWIQVRAVAASPHRPGVFLAGSDVGLHISEDSGVTWDFIASPADRHQVWAIAFHPTDPSTILVGGAPFETDVNIIRTRDGGATWQVLDVPVPGRSIVGATHITSIQFDPRDSDTIWASCELGGLYQSQDGGDTWRKAKVSLGDEPVMGDIHAVMASPRGRIFATTPRGLHISEDEAETFRLHEFPPFPDPEPAGVPHHVLHYCRGITQKADDPDVLMIGTGDYTPGKTGSIQRSTDRGDSWTAADLSHPANSHFYTISAHPADPDYLVAATMFGYVYISQDGGLSWDKIPREFGEIRGLAWAPN